MGKHGCSHNWVLVNKVRYSDSKYYVLVYKCSKCGDSDTRQGEKIP